MAAQDEFCISGQNACKSKALLPDGAVGRDIGFARGTAENKASGEDRWGTGNATKWEGRQSGRGQGKDVGGGEGVRR